MTTGTLSDQRVRWAAIVALASVLCLSILRIPAVFNAVGYVAVLWVVDLTNIIAAAIGCVLSFLLYFSFDRSERHKAIWGFLAVGLLLWSLGEAIWAFYELVLKQELPYPSFADVVWVIGYIPLFISLWLRFRTLRRTPQTGQLVVVLGIFVVLVALAVVFVIGPIVTYPEYEPIEKFLDTLYPIGDLTVALGALLSVLALSGGALSRSWALIAAGFLLIACSDILFSYMTWNEIYIHETPDLFSSLLDITYYASYALMALGIYIQARIQRVA
jgi:hypothetical protein